VQWPLSSTRFLSKIYDKDKLSLDDLVASYKFNLKKLISECEDNEGSEVYWKNIYGAPNGTTNAHATHMNENPEKASTWKGRILIQVDVKDEPHPKLMCQALEPDVKQQLIAKEFFNNNEFEIVAEIGGGISLPGEKNYHIKITINDFEIETDDPKEMKNGYCRWSERFD
jgi:hypothetical protein